MAAKTIQVSADGLSNWLTLPGNTGDFSVEAAQLEDTVFGAEFQSQFPGLFTWNVTSNALLRGTAGYCAKVLKSGTPTAFSDENMAQVGTSDVYEIVDRDKSVWDWNETVVFEDNGGVIAASNIRRIFHVQGQVEFIGSFSPSGTVTVSGDYLPMTEFGRANTISLSQTADTTDTSDFETACANGGWATQDPTLLNADLELSGFYRAANGLFDLLTSRGEFVIEIDPVGDGEQTARGIYRGSTDSQTGDVGGDEEESFSLVLSVPEDTVPFRWRYTTDSIAPAAIVLVQSVWAERGTLHVRYLPEGEDEEGRQGESIVTDFSLEVAVDGLPEYSVTLDGTGPAEAINTY